MTQKDYDQGQEEENSWDQYFEHPTENFDSEHYLVFRFFYLLRPNNDNRSHDHVSFILQAFR